MGRIVDGQWTERDDKFESADGRFRREESRLRGRIGEAPEAGRYHLLCAWPCPWSHRVMLVRAILGLETAIGLTLCDSRMGTQGWYVRAPGPDLPPGAPGAWLHDYYTRSLAGYTGRATVPALWDRATRAIVNNESRDLVSMLAIDLLPLARAPLDLRPAELAAEIDRWCEFQQTALNDAVYRTGYATTAAAHAEARAQVFDALGVLDTQLREREYLAGATLTLADVYAFPTLVRFDAVYATLMRCDLRRIDAYPHLWRYLCRLYRRPEFRGTVDFAEYRAGYFANLAHLLPGASVRTAPELDPGRDCTPA